MKIIRQTPEGLSEKAAIESSEFERSSTVSGRPQSETVLAALVLGVFLFLNLCTAERSPTVWTDEVGYTDPAVNFAQGRGFTSAAWFVQSRDKFFAGNSPLHSLCLCPWITCFGISPMAVRSFNYVLMVAACGILWWTLARQRLVRSKLWRALVVIVILCGNGVTFSYRSARYDCLGILLIVCIWSISLRRESRARYLGLTLLCAALPWAGLQLIPYITGLSVLNVFFRGRNGVKDLFVVGAGVLLGALSMYLLFVWQGVWLDFQNSVHGGIGGRSTSLGHRFLDAFRSLAVDPSMVLLGGLLVLVLGWDAIRHRSQARMVLLAGAFFATAIPFALAFVGKFPIYYSWMAYIPAAICLATWLEQATLGWVGKALVAMVVTAACLIGLPARTMVTLAEWDLRDYRPVRELIKQKITPEDWVYCGFEGYYAAKVVTPDVFLPPYREVMSARERDSMTVIVVRPESVTEAIEYFGGCWTCIAAYDANTEQRFSIAGRWGFGSKPYQLAIYRRER